MPKAFPEGWASLRAGSRELIRRLCTKFVLLGSYLPGPVGPAVVGRVIEESFGQRLVTAGHTIRSRYEATRPFDPLSNGRDVPPIEVFIPCVLKDLPTLRLAIEGARLGSRNPISRVTVCAPERDVAAISAEVGAAAFVIAEEEVQSPGVVAQVDRIVPPERRNWVVQQLLKLGYVAQSRSQGVLVIDADTVLLRQRTWLADGCQLLAISREMHVPYRDHVRTWLGDRVADSNVSFVTHHQLMQPGAVRAMLSCGSGSDRLKAEDSAAIDVGLRCWLGAADFSLASALSEYHSYGAWLTFSQPKQTARCSWGNVEPRRLDASAEFDELRIATLRSEYPEATSVTFHSWKRGSYSLGSSDLSFGRLDCHLRVASDVPPED